MSHKEKKDKHFLKKPYYDGGPEAMKAFINQHLQYPREAMKQGVEGTVVLRITIDYKGRVVDSKIISGIGAGCDEEAQRVAELLHFEVPRTRGVKVTFHKKLQIHFRKKGQQGTTRVQYSVTGSETREEDNAESDSSSGGYTYTINIR